jgi:hypothetical protein
MTTLTQDAERLRQMADEVCAITARIRPHIQSETREDMAFNVHSFVAGGCHGLQASATMLLELERELNG